jgi:RND family efflux transporter MFP subunit
MKKSLLLMITVMLSACDQPPPPVQPPRPTLVVEVGSTQQSSAMVLVGEVRPRYESNQGFRINGKIIARVVELGAQVKKGQVLAKLDSADVNLSMASATADVRAAEANYALAVAEVERQRQLFDKKFISASALDLREAELKTASARLAQVKAQANISGNQTRYTQLTADRDGVVTMIRAEPGQLVQAGEVIVSIASLSEMEVLLAVPESRMGLVKINMPVTVKMWANPQWVYTGLVREISPVADSATRAFNIRVSVNAADEKVKLGMTAGVKFEHPNMPETVQWQIPSSALTYINGKKSVWVIDENNKAQTREVEAGEFSEHGIFISRGLKAGERVAIAGVHTLVKGQLVKPVLEIAP